MTKHRYRILSVILCVMMTLDTTTTTSITSTTTTTSTTKKSTTTTTSTTSTTTTTSTTKKSTTTTTSTTSTTTTTSTTKKSTTTTTSTTSTTTTTCRLVGEYDGDYDVISARLHRMFGDTPVPADSTAHSMKRTVGEGEETRYYELEESQVQDDKGHLTGSYLRIQDITEDERDRRRRDAQIGQISQEAYRDALTGVGNKAAYNKAVAALNEEISRGLCRFAVVMVDMNNLKQINDEHGHRAGDAYIKGCCHLICEMFKHSPVFRIGGDEFAVILTEQDYENRAGLVERLRDAYEQAVADMSVEPWERYSAAVGIAEHASDDNSYELVFKRADAAMYDEKKAFKIKHGSYR